MKIGIFTDDFYPMFGGQGRHLIEIYNKIYKNSKDFLVYSPNKNNIQNHKTIVHFSKYFGKNIIFSLILNFRINNIINSARLTTVHFHCGPGGIILIKKPNAKMICTVHHTYYQQQKYIPFQKWKYIFYLLEKIMYKNADKIITVSEDTRNTIINEYNISPNKVIFIPNGVDYNIFKKIKGIKKIPNSLFFIGRLDKRKGIEFLVKTIPLIKKEIPSIKLYIRGQGKLRKKLERFIDKNNLKNNVEFLGFINEKDLPKFYNKFKLTIVPSIFEGFGINVIESLACGTPVIGTDTDGIRELIKDKKFLAKFGDKEDLSRKIISVLKDKPKIKFDKNKYNWNDISKKTLEVYK